MARYRHDKNSTVSSDPILGSRWHPEKNTGMDPAVLTTGSGKRANFICEHGHEYNAIIRRARKCPVCTGKIATPENCLAVTHPKILKEWDYSRNSDLSPYNLTAHTTKLVNLKCQFGHPYQMQVHWWVRGRHCPYCAGKKVDIKESLAVKYPKIAKDWDYEVNGDLTPEMVLPYSHIKAGFKCENNHRWLAVIKNRTIKGSGCPYCAGLKIALEDSLAILKPDIALQWHKKKNKGKTPYDVSLISRFLATWQCPKRKTHIYKEYVFARVAGKECPLCEKSH